MSLPLENYIYEIQFQKSVFSWAIHKITAPKVWKFIIYRNAQQQLNEIGKFYFQQLISPIVLQHLLQVTPRYTSHLWMLSSVNIAASTPNIESVTISGLTSLTTPKMKPVMILSFIRKVTSVFYYFTPAGVIPMIKNLYGELWVWHKFSLKQARCQTGQTLGETLVCRLWKFLMVTRLVRQT